MTGNDITTLLVAAFGLLGTYLTLHQNRKLNTIDHNVNSRADKQDQRIASLQDEIDTLRQYINNHPTNIDPAPPLDLPPSTDKWPTPPTTKGP